MFELTSYMLGFVVLSGVMALVEAAVLSVSQAEVEELVLRRAWGSQSLHAVSNRMTRAVVVLVVFTNVINILGPMLVARKAIALFGDPVLGWITAILTLATILFSEVIPKSLGAHYAPLVSRTVAPALVGLIYLLYPIVIALEWLLNQIKTGKRPIGTEAQIRSLVSIGRRAGYIESGEGRLIHRAFVLNDKTAGDIMTPLKEIVSVNESTTIRQAARHVLRHAYSRYPMFGKSINEPLGLVLSRDILAALTEGKNQQSVAEIARPCFVVSRSLRSDQLLARFRDQRIHLAIVQDDDKHTVGVVTLEDVLEELVGEIEDEKDAESFLNKAT